MAKLRSFICQCFTLILSLAPAVICEAQNNPVESVRNEPTCPTCRLLFGPVEPAVVLAGDSTVWLGRYLGAAVDPMGRLYVSDAFRHKVLRIDTQRRQALWFGREGKGPGEFQVPVLIAPTAQGDVFIYDLVLRRVSKFDETGAFQGSFQLPIQISQPKSLVADTSGHVYLSSATLTAESANSVIHMMTEEGVLVRSFAARGKQFPTQYDQLNDDGGKLWWDAETNTVWISRSGPDFELSQYDVQGRHLQRIRFGTVPDWQPSVVRSVSAGRTFVRGGAQMGSVGLFHFRKHYLVNVSRVHHEKMIYQFHVFQLTTGDLVARWSQEFVEGGPIAKAALTDGLLVGIKVADGDIELVRFPVRFNRDPHIAQRKNR